MFDQTAIPSRYASASEVVRAGLRALQERDAAVEKWLREEVVGVCDAMQSDLGGVIPAEQVFATIRARHADRLKPPTGLIQSRGARRLDRPL